MNIKTIFTHQYVIFSMQAIETYKILVADDNEAVRAQIEDAFSSLLQQYTVIFAQNTEEAIDLAKSEFPDVFILDIEIEGGKGFDILHSLKSDLETIDIPVIIVTDTDNIEKAFQEGAADFIKKPIQNTELTLRVKSILSLYKLIKEMARQAEELETQKQTLEVAVKRTDELLNNIFPFEIAEQLKYKGKADAKKYRMVSILFTDFKGFTSISTKLPPEEIIKELSIFFEKFDEITERHYIEKIKTIGDAYMCVGGLPLRNKSNPIDTVLAALQIQKFTNGYNKLRIESNLDPWPLRLGIHTGKVIAGVIGKKKFTYDIWGDAVNTAARMESSGEIEKVNISGETFEHIQKYFDCTYRGKIPAKNKGDIDMYFVNGLKPDYCKPNDNTEPNTAFKKILSTY